MEEGCAPGFPLLEEMQAVSVLGDGGFGGEIAVYETDGAGVDVVGVAVGIWGISLLGCFICEVMDSVGVGEIER